LSLAHNNCVGVARGLLGERGRVWSADHNGHGAATEFPGETVSVKCGRCCGGNPYQVRRYFKPHRFRDSVRVPDHVFSRRERRDERHGELRELDQAAVAKSARLGRLSGNQVNTHELDATRGTCRRWIGPPFLCRLASSFSSSASAGTSHIL